MPKILHADIVIQRYLLHSRKNFGETYGMPRNVNEILKRIRSDQERWAIISQKLPNQLTN